MYALLQMPGKCRSRAKAEHVSDSDSLVDSQVKIALVQFNILYQRVVVELSAPTLTTTNCLPSTSISWVKCVCSLNEIESLSIGKILAFNLCDGEVSCWWLRCTVAVTTKPMRVGKPTSRVEPVNCNWTTNRKVGRHYTNEYDQSQAKAK